MLPAHTPSPITFLDTETSGLHPDDGARVSLVQVGWYDEDGELVVRVFPFGQAETLNTGCVDSGRTTWMALLRWLRKRKLVIHNATFDLHMMKAGTKTGYKGQSLVHALHWDTMLAQRHLDPNEQVGLKDTAPRLFDKDGGIRATYTFLGKDGYEYKVQPDENLEWESGLKAELKKTRPTKRYDLVGLPEMTPYAKADIVWLARLYELQMERLTHGEGTWNRIEHKMAVCRMLYGLEERGLGFAADECAQAGELLHAKMTTIAAELPFDPTPIKARKYYFDKLGLPKYADHLTAKRKDPQMNAEVRALLIRDGAPDIELYDRYCRYETAWSMWYRSWPEKTGQDGRLRTQYKQAQVVSGRMSVGRVQLHAIPHDYQLPIDRPRILSIREYIRAEPESGKTLYEVDLSQAEVRIATAWAKCAPMHEAIVAGVDAHDATVYNVWGIDNTHPEWKMYRNIGKRCTFCALYAGGAPTLQRTVAQFTGQELSLEQARAILADYRRAFPQFTDAATRAARLFAEHGFVELAEGDKRWWDSKRDRRKWGDVPVTNQFGDPIMVVLDDDDTPVPVAFKYYRNAFNQIIQGSVATLVEKWMLAIDAKYPGALVLQVHDSVWLETADTSMPDDVAEMGKAIVHDGVEAFTGVSIPFDCDVKSIGRPSHWAPEGEPA